RHHSRLLQLLGEHDVPKNRPGEVDSVEPLVPEPRPDQLVEVFDGVFPSDELDDRPRIAEQPARWLGLKDERGVCGRGGGWAKQKHRDREEAQSHQPPPWERKTPPRYPMRLSRATPASQPQRMAVTSPVQEATGRSTSTAEPRQRNLRCSLLCS